MTHSPSFTSPADELRELAAECLAIERHHGGALLASTPRIATRAILADYAHELGIPKDERSAAIDAALTAAGTTP